MARTVSMTVPLVTGGGSGIGQATARALVARGAQVMVADINEDAARETAAGIGGAAVTVDVADEASVGAMVTYCVERFGGLDWACNIAGIAPDPKPFVEELYRSMKPGAAIGIIDHIASPGGNVRAVAQKLHRIDPERVKSDFLAAGFVLDGESAILRNSSDDHSRNVFDEAVRLRTDQMILRFRKPR